MTSLTPGRLTYKDLLVLIRSGDIDTVILAITDMQGRLQGKRMDASFFADDIGEAAIDGCSYLLASDVDMHTVDGFRADVVGSRVRRPRLQGRFHHDSPRSLARKISDSLRRR